jgi:hypothetical protein
MVMDFYYTKEYFPDAFVATHYILFCATLFTLLTKIMHIPFKIAKGLFD